MSELQQLQIVPHVSSVTARRWIAKILICLEYLLLISGILILAFDLTALSEGKLQSRALLRRFNDLQLTTPQSQLNSNSIDGTIDNGPLNQSKTVNSRGPAYSSSTVLAEVRISRLGIAVPLLDGTDALTLNHAVGHIAGTARPGELGNIGIAGHRDSFFRGLKDVHVGDVIELERRSGTDKYVVDKILIVTPSDVDVLRSRRVPSLTLITCYPFYFIGNAPQRFVVEASLKAKP